MIRVFLADDHPLLRIGLRYSFDQDEAVGLVGEAADGFTAVERIHADPPDVALIDVDMPGLSGIGIIRVLRKSHPTMKILVLSTYNDERYIREAMKAGADGYILKNIESDELIRIIKRVFYGEEPVSPYLVNLTLGLDGAELPLDSEMSPRLTVREEEILQSLMAGKTNKEIAGQLNISLETVKSHTKNIYQKLKVRNRLEAARAAYGKSLFRNQRLQESAASR